MRKILWVLAVVLLLGGCQRAEPGEVPARVAGEIRISGPCQRERSIREPARLQRILLLLRSLQGADVRPVSPDDLSGPCWNLTVRLSDGTTERLCIRGGCYMSREPGSWYAVHGPAMGQLNSLLQGD